MTVSGSSGTGLTLAPGQRLGPYEILGPLGAGGMGEVSPAVRLGEGVAGSFSPDGSGYAYSQHRILSDLFLVDGLR